MNDKPKPLAPAAGSNMPEIASAGLVVGAPVAVTAQVGGIALPAFSAMRILPIAASLVAMSSTIGISPAVGTAIAIGLLPTTRSPPPGGGISGRVLHIAMPMQSAAAACSA